MLEVKLCSQTENPSLAAKIQILGDDPRPSDSKSMRGFDGYLTADSGEYRIIYRIDTCGAVLLVATLNN